jgi:hypothetical protein
LKINSLVLFLVLAFGVSSFAADSTAYRKCFKDKMTAAMKANPCKFDSYTAAESSAENACAMVLMKALMDSGKKPNPESVDAAKRAAYNDYDDMIEQEGKRCGVHATASGNTITVTPGGAK